MSGYGKACSQCTKAKVRCSYSNDSGPCERCVLQRLQSQHRRGVEKCSPCTSYPLVSRAHRASRCTRLRKECQPAARSRITKREPRADKHRALEDKVNSLVELLKKNQTLPDNVLSDHGVDATAQTQRCGPALVTSQLFSLSMHAADAFDPSSNSTSPDTQTTTGSVCSTASNSLTTTSLPKIDPATVPPETKEDLQDVLDTYRNEMFQTFPVVFLGPEVTVEYMATERPFVWLILRTICTKRLARQFVLAAQVKRIIANTIVVEGERSFDMLCALVLYINWGQFFCIKANLTAPIHLAAGLAGDLGLTKPAPHTSPAVMMNWTPRGCPKPPQALLVKSRTMEERRIVLGLFFVSSICANFFQRSEPMRWTPYLEDCLKLLTETKEYPSDEVLAILIRIQLIANCIHAEGWNEVYPFSSANQKIPRNYHIRIHKMQMDDLRRSIPGHLATNQSIRFHMLGLEVTVYEQHLLPTAITSNLDQIQCIEGLWSCFTAVKAYMESMFDIDIIPPVKFLYISIGLCAQLGHCLVALFRLSTFESPGVQWDRQRVITELDLGNMVRKWVHIFEVAPRVAGIDLTGTGDTESQWDYGRKLLLNTILKWWDSKARPSIMSLFEQTPAQSSETQPNTATGFDPLSPRVDLGVMDFNFDNELWMKDILNSGFDFTPF